jgi:uncharacterized membrane protein
MGHFTRHELKLFFLFGWSLLIFQSFKIPLYDIQKNNVINSFDLKENGISKEMEMESIPNLK